ncbi:hypothetical protein DXP70_08125 [Listeria monocytogenes]|nr:hypothetical protein [Listeria monocytogenes]MDB03026.1 hypothetical protein [Listeria monocytogenes]MDB35370.1 hypothetical protein [Listeria monocytogenes]
MSSELMKKLEAAKIDTSSIDYGHDGATRIQHIYYNNGITHAIKIAKEYEAKQMKDLNFIAFDDETEEHERLKEIISYLDLKDPMTVEERVKRMSAELDKAFGIEQGKLEEEEEAE